MMIHFKRNFSLKAVILVTSMMMGHLAIAVLLAAPVGASAAPIHVTDFDDTLIGSELNSPKPVIYPKERELRDEALPNLQHFELNGEVLPKNGACESLLLEAQRRLNRLLTPAEIEMVLPKILSTTGEQMMVESDPWYRAPRGLMADTPIFLKEGTAFISTFQPGHTVFSVDFNTGDVVPNKVVKVWKSKAKYVSDLHDWGIYLSSTCLVADESGDMHTVFQAPSHLRMATAPRLVRKLGSKPLGAQMRRGLGSESIEVIVYNLELEYKQANNFIVRGTLIVGAVGTEDKTTRIEDWESVEGKFTKGIYKTCIPTFEDFLKSQGLFIDESQNSKL